MPQCYNCGGRAKKPSNADSKAGHGSHWLAYLRILIFFCQMVDESMLSHFLHLPRQTFQLTNDVLRGNGDLQILWILTAPLVSEPKAKLYYLFWLQTFKMLLGQCHERTGYLDTEMKNWFSFSHGL